MNSINKISNINKTNIISFVNDMIAKYANDRDTLRLKLYEYNIKTLFEPESKKGSKNRVIIYTDKINTYTDNKFTKNSNGLILEIDTWKILCIFQNILVIPLLSLKYITEIKQLSKQEDKKYYIYNLNDGTTINLYWCNNNTVVQQEEKGDIGEWILSTNKGIEVNDLKWMGDKSYINILNQLLLLYPEFSWEKLDKTQTHTIGFNYPDFHPFQSNINTGRIWFIRSISNIDGTVTYTNDIGLPYMKQSTIDITKINEICNNSIANYFSDSLQIPCFGFIIRNNKDESFIIESTLFKKIKYFIYSSRHNNIIRNNKYQRLPYVIISYYLDININNSNNIFLKLFPQYVPVYNKFNSIVENIAIKIAKHLLDTSDKSILSSNTDENKLIIYLWNNISKYIRQSYETREQLINDIIKYIINVDYLIYYYPLFSLIVLS